jgi:hypothetical protein
MDDNRSTGEEKVRAGWHRDVQKVRKSGVVAPLQPLDGDARRSACGRPFGSSPEGAGSRGCAQLPGGVGQIAGSMIRQIRRAALGRSRRQRGPKGPWHGQGAQALAMAVAESGRSGSDWSGITRRNDGSGSTGDSGGLGHRSGHLASRGEVGLQPDNHPAAASEAALGWPER